MADYTGQNVYIAWIHQAGTAVLSTDYRSVSTSPSIGLAECTAGADTDKTFIATVKEGSISYSGLHQIGGTVIKNALVEGASGTLIIGPEGTVAGKPKETYPAISMGAKMNYPYSDVVEISVEFTNNGAATMGVYP